MIDCHNHIGVELSLYLRDEFPYAQHLVTMVETGRELGLERFVVFPSPTPIAFSLEQAREGKVTLEGGLERVPYIWDNRRMMREIYEMFPDAGAATTPFAMVDPMRETQAQAAELRSLRRDYRFHGLKMQTTIIQSRVTSLMEQGRVFLEMAEEFDIPLLLHSSVHPDDPWAQAKDIIDIAEATPNVRFCAAHSCRFDREQLDRIAALPNTWFDCSAHGIHCELAVQNHPTVAPVQRRFASNYSDAAQVLCDLAAAYPDKLLWGSDSPFYSFVAQVGEERIALISSHKAEVDYLMAVPQELRNKISLQNTLCWLGRPS
jgi:predicted TIM-barrel fold metal-dependent hydrolase